MWETENQLVDDYVRGRLSTSERDRFESHYLTSVVHAQRLEFAQQLIAQAALGELEAGTTQRAEKKPGLFARLGLSQPAWGYAFAAALLLLAIATAWLIFARTRIRNELTQIQKQNETTESNRRALEEQIAKAREKNDQLSSELAQLKPGQPSPSPVPSPTQEATAPTYAFFLSPILIRGSGDPQTLSIPAGTEIVRLQMSVDPEGVERFQVRVRTVEGQQIWQQHVQNSGKKAVATQIPANRLPRGDYILTLPAVTKTGNLEEVNRYFFRVTGP